MSRYSGRFDLADHISGLSGWSDKNGNKVDNTYSGPRYGNEWEDFLVFKKQTNGVLHQHKKVVVSEWNQEQIKNLCSQFDFTEHTKIIKDKRLKSGEREEKYFTYTYYGKEYSSLKELNKKGVYITIDIKFDTLLDLIPYYPYIISVACHNEEGAYIVIGDRPQYLRERDNSLSSGGRVSNYWQSYAKKLQDHYREIVLNYYNPEGREVIEELDFKLEKDNNNLSENDLGFEHYYVAKASYDIDDQFAIEWVFDNGPLSHWTSPKILGKHFIKMSKEDAESYLGTKMKVKYVRVKSNIEDK